MYVRVSFRAKEHEECGRERERGREKGRAWNNAGWRCVFFVKTIERKDMMKYDGEKNLNKYD